MRLFLDILTEITLPIVAIAVLGFVAQRRLSFDVASLNRLLVQVVLPCSLLHFLSTGDLPLAAVWPTVWFTLVQFVALTAIGWGAAAALGLPAELRPVLGLAAAFANSGNYGIPLAQLAFPPEYLLHQAVIVSLHSVLIVSLGVALVARDGDAGWTGSLRAAFRTPMIPAVALGLLLRGLDVGLPTPLALPLGLMGNAYTPLALFALGAQLALGGRRAAEPLPVGLALTLKLVLAPALTWAAAAALGLAAGLTDLLVVAAGTPVGVLLAILCAEYRVRPEIASAAVFASTALSPLSATAWVLATRL